MTQAPEPETVQPAEPEVTQTPVRARALHGVTVALINGGWKKEWKPEVMAWIAGLTELLGGAMMLLGLFSRMWGLGLAIAMCFAFYLTSWPGPFNVVGLFQLAEGGDGYVSFNRMFCQLGLLVMGLGIFLTGAGPLSLDRAFFRRRQSRMDDLEFDTAPEPKITV
jgi:putative oxidoreductase